MFDISFTEILVIAVVALIVLGPERLPQVARTLGHLFGRAQRYVNDVKNDIQHEMELEELKKLKTSVQEAARSIESAVRTEINQFQDIAAETKSVTATDPLLPPKDMAEAASSVNSPATPNKSA
ncbi:MAG: Sec-independent protein translocase protein TatB [Nitrosospira sp.]